MIIGRKHEKELLKRYRDSNEPELVVVYGRRRVGKTYLVRKFFNEEFFFYFTGSENSTREDQLDRFGAALREHGMATAPAIRTWSEAFGLLKELVVGAGPGQDAARRKVIFFDEMPWMDTPKSGFLGAFEYFWNSFASARDDVLFIICGSAASWMTRNVFKNRGGLHNRVTGKIAVKPFTLYETEEYLQSKNVVFGRYDIVECDMILGGIPYYLRYIDGRYSLSQNIDDMLFAEDAPLKDEFAAIYASLFKHPKNHLEVIHALSSKRMGLTREEIIDATGLENGGRLTEVLEDLELSGFTRRYNAFPNKKRGTIYQSLDSFSLFHAAFLQSRRSTDPHFWTLTRNTPAANSWKGYAFEMLCLRHVGQIKRALGIQGVLTNVSGWRSQAVADEDQDVEDGKSVKRAQIDLILDRADNIVNLCEMKYSTNEYAIDAAEEARMRNRSTAFASQTGTKKGLHITMVTTYGIKRNTHSGIVSSTVTMDDLFAQL
jgi:AAA+ ATPase superfamily predicted ATPase